MKLCVMSLSAPRYLAEWMSYGYPTANVWPLDITRFGSLQSSRTFLRHRVMEVMREWLRPAAKPPLLLASENNRNITGGITFYP